ncbi:MULTISPECIES: hypothetical protein [Pantoea]|uniref:hypothetical protein n=1 Tax=Pantoea TaxID=53335 RepID=UPI001231FABA|nr:MULTISPECIES: hypothetical protein [unclassified Pantoea]KAA6103350.1 hypothetical protein F3I21_01100 [Pantoea sp. B_9]KAA6111751.1 hypothetical protein F3I18_15125 [Pantoea sp. B_10]
MNNKQTNRQMGISFEPHVMDQLFELAATRQHGSVKTIIEKSVKHYLKTLNSNMQETNNDRSNPIK